MMRLLKFGLIGILFGIVMTKSEAVSWFRIQEMFRFESFHMYGIIGTAVIVGGLVTAFIKRTMLNNTKGQPIEIYDKAMSVPRYLFGGIIFGLGWAISGACPGPMFTLLGHGIGSMPIVIASAVLGTYVYGLLRSRLPH